MGSEMYPLNILKANQQRGSKPRCHLLTNGSKCEIARWFIAILLVISLTCHASEISSLIEDLGDKEKAIESSQKLAEIGKSAIPDLIQALENGSKYQKRYAARAVREMGQDGADAIPSLGRLLKEWDVPTREYAVEALGNMYVDIEKVMPYLKQAQEDSNNDIGEKAELLISRLRKIIRNPDLLSGIIKVLVNRGSGKICSTVELQESSITDCYTGIITFESNEKIGVKVNVSQEKIQYEFFEISQNGTNPLQVDSSGISSKSTNEEIEEVMPKDVVKTQENKYLIDASKLKCIKEFIIKIYGKIIAKENIVASIIGLTLFVLTVIIFILYFTHYIEKKYFYQLLDFPNVVLIEISVFVWLVMLLLTSLYSPSGQPLTISSSSYLICGITSSVCLMMVFVRNIHNTRLLWAVVGLGIQVLIGPIFAFVLIISLIVGLLIAIATIGAVTNILQILENYARKSSKC